MARRRFLYLVFLTLSFFYYLFYTWYVSWIVFLFVLLLPLLSAVLSLPLAHRCCAVMESGTRSAGQKEGFRLSFYIEAGGTYATAARLKVTTENLFSGVVKGYEIYLTAGEHYMLHVSGESCGVTRSSVFRASVTDLLGLFWIPVSVKTKLAETLLVPEKIAYQGKIEPDDGKGKAKQALENGEWTGIRDYRNGDSLRSVHWKLTARTGKTVVREYEKADEERLAWAVFIWGGAHDALCRSLGRLFGVIEAFQKAGYFPRILWIERDETRIIMGEELEAELWSVLRRIPDEYPSEPSLIPEEVLCGGSPVLYVAHDTVRPVGTMGGSE